MKEIYIFDWSKNTNEYFLLILRTRCPISSTLSDCAQCFESCFNLKHPRNFNCYLVTSPRILDFCCPFVASFHDLATLIEKSLPICFSNTLPTFRETEKSLSTFLRDFRGKISRLRLVDGEIRRRSSGKLIDDRCFHHGEKEARDEREIPSRGGECSLTGRQTAVSNQNRGVSNCHPPRQLNSGSRWCTTATHNLPRHVDDFTWQMYCDNSLINVELNGTTLP